MLKCTFFLVIFLTVSALSGSAQTPAPDHFYNPPENIAADPNYTPGDWPLPETYPAKVQYEVHKGALLETYGIDSSKHLFTLGIGDIAASVLKNEKVPVRGTFKNYFGVARLGNSAPEKMEMIIDMNSFDTGVPGRNNRILAIFFESMKPELGTARIVFDQYDLGDKTLQDLSDGTIHRIEASGSITLNGTIRGLSAVLSISQLNGTWSVKTQSPIKILISDFNFENRIYDLMKECNHAAMGNHVEIEADLYFR